MMLRAICMLEMRQIKGEKTVASNRAPTLEAQELAEWFVGNENGVK